MCWSNVPPANLSTPEGSAEDEEDPQDTVRKILEEGQRLSKAGKAKELGDLIKSTRPMLNSFSKAKAAKLVRALVDMFLDMEAATGLEVELCKECIDWAQHEKRTFLRQSLEIHDLCRHTHIPLNLSSLRCSATAHPPTSGIGVLCIHHYTAGGCDIRHLLIRQVYSHLGPVEMCLLLHLIVLSCLQDECHKCRGFGGGD
ncbi:hypothetical protein HPB51_012012 [Rhipicephalus microplus]|uniref:26S proteasome regulatory subunit Rpn6 N-terminal domain-containing protein n=1 Tax=Rhipicephalus microplus TaxID=6941 RepID=A0A9J6F2B0_RHIMP|nr:hypothetical protein HPB51_012012 [Rhipicephalus microplus]